MASRPTGNPSPPWDPPDYDFFVDGFRAEELRKFGREWLSTYAHPREVAFGDQLPKTPSGKTQRFVLHERAAQGALSVQDSR